MAEKKVATKTKREKIVQKSRGKEKDRLKGTQIARSLVERHEYLVAAPGGELFN